MSGKSYAQRDYKNQRPADQYHTPFSLVWELLKYETFINCADPAYGNGAIVKAAEDKINFIYKGDIATGQNFLDLKQWNGDIFTNPPFSLWDEFIKHAKKLEVEKFCFLGKTNFLGCVGRYENSIWNNLRKVYIFNRYVDYRTPYREDGLFHVGVLCTGWFVWDREYLGKPVIEILNVQKYAKLGNLK